MGRSSYFLASCLAILTDWDIAGNSPNGLTINKLRNIDREDFNKQRNLTMKYIPGLLEKYNTRSLHYPRNFFNISYFNKAWD